MLLKLLTKAPRRFYRAPRVASYASRGSRPLAYTARHPGPYYYAALERANRQTRTVPDSIRTVLNQSTYQQRYGSLHSEFARRMAKSLQIPLSRTPKSLPGVRESALFSARAAGRQQNRPTIQGQRLFQRALTCGERMIRREVLHALGLTKLGAMSKKRHYTNKSGVRC